MTLFGQMLGDEIVAVGGKLHTPGVEGEVEQGKGAVDLDREWPEVSCPSIVGGDLYNRDA